MNSLKEKLRELETHLTEQTKLLKVNVHELEDQIENLKSRISHNEGRIFEVREIVSYLDEEARKGPLGEPGEPGTNSPDS